MSNHLNIANRLNEPIYVMIAPNEDWMIADAFAGVAGFRAGDGSGRLCLWKDFGGSETTYDGITMGGAPALAYLPPNR